MEIDISEVQEIQPMKETELLKYLEDHPTKAYTISELIKHTRYISKGVLHSVAYNLHKQGKINKGATKEGMRVYYHKPKPTSQA